MNRCPHCQAKITVPALMRFGDYKCPYCRQFAKFSDGWLAFIAAVSASIGRGIAHDFVGMLGFQNAQLAAFTKVLLMGVVIAAAVIFSCLFLVKPKALS